jgi:hypothetical protein
MPILTGSGLNRMSVSRIDGACLWFFRNAVSASGFSIRFYLLSQLRRFSIWQHMCLYHMAQAA